MRLFWVWIFWSIEGLKINHKCRKCRLELYQFNICCLWHSFRSFWAWFIVIFVIVVYHFFDSGLNDEFGAFVERKQAYVDCETLQWNDIFVEYCIQFSMAYISICFVLSNSGPFLHGSGEIDIKITQIWHLIVSNPHDPLFIAYYVSLDLGYRVFAFLAREKGYSHEIIFPP